MFSETCFSVQVVLPHPGNPMSMIISQSSRLPILQQQKQRHQSISQKTMVASIKKKKKTNIVSATTGCPNKFWMDIFLTENLKNAKLEFSKKIVKKNCQIEVRFALLS